MFLLTGPTAVLILHQMKVERLVQGQRRKGVKGDEHRTLPIVLVSFHLWHNTSQAIGQFRSTAPLSGSAAAEPVHFASLGTELGIGSQVQQYTITVSSRVQQERTRNFSQELDGAWHGAYMRAVLHAWGPVDK